MSSVVSSIFGGAPAGTTNDSNLIKPTTAAQASTAYDNTNSSINQQQSFLQALQGQNGIGNQSNVFNQLQGVTDGTGPNPAQAMLNQSTAANTANQAALMAGQRGSSANSGLIARQAAMQGAQNQQQAIGQGATLQANQSLNALNAQGNIANQQVANRQNAGNALGNQSLQQQQNLLGSIQGQNSNQMDVSKINSQAAQANAAMQAQLIGNVAGAVGSAAMLAEGGQVPGTGPRSASVRAMLAGGGKVPALVSPGEQYLPPQAAQAVASGQSKPFNVGERIPGKPKVAGNSYANDTVPKTLESGGVVIPNAIMQSKDAEKKAAEFVRQVMAKNGTLPKAKK